MKKYSFIKVAGALLVGASLLVSSVAFAQTSSMPTLYDQNGNAVNTGVGTLPAGSYYLGAGPAQGGHLVNYFGNGTYYDPSTQAYGGNVSDSNGTAGMVFNTGVVPVVTPGVPNTGAGGTASTTWMVLFVSAAAVVLSLAYLGRRAWNA